MSPLPPVVDVADVVDVVDKSWGWHLNRVLGVLLVVLVPLHFAVVIIGGDVGRTTAAGEATRFTGIAWRALAWFLVLAALTHAWLSWSEQRRTRARIRVDEVESRRQGLIPAAVLTAGVALALTATYILFTYR